MISMYSNELQLELNRGNCMDKIAMVKKEIHLQNWSDKELARQESGLTVTEWCRQEKISTSAYIIVFAASEKSCANRYLFR